MAAVTVVDAATVAVQRLGYAAMKPEQLQVVSGIVSGRDVFAVCPLARDFLPNGDHMLRGTSVCRQY